MFHHSRSIVALSGGSEWTFQPRALMGDVMGLSTTECVNRVDQRLVACYGTLLEVSFSGRQNHRELARWPVEKVVQGHITSQITISGGVLLTFRPQ